MKKMLFLMAAMLFAGSLAMAGDLVDYYTMFSDESPYAPGESVRISAAVQNVNSLNTQIKLEWTLMDPLGFVVNGQIVNVIPAGIGRVLSWSKPLPEGAPAGMYTWTGGLYARNTAHPTYALQNTSMDTFTIGTSSGAPGGLFRLFFFIDPETVNQGGSFIASATVENGLMTPTPVQLDMEIHTPTGGTLILGPYTLTVDPNVTKELGFRISVPSMAPLGNYAATGRLLDDEGEVLASVPGSFTVLGTAFSTVIEEARAALAAVPCEGYAEPANCQAAYDALLAQLNETEGLYNAGSLNEARALVGQIIDNLSTVFYNSGDFAAKIGTVRDYVDSAISPNFTYTFD